MGTVWLAIYILMWPALTIGVLAVIWVAVLKELRAAKREGEDAV
ncbi:MAG TPA: putative transporter small subunit [Pseudonocardia sp.]|jgi:hypothetical protein|nr:putative transporter small subunit [Pseudonocardia sp.]HLU56036.1 putative transporter small subunit [Pseudonocardia sp.]